MKWNLTTVAVTVAAAAVAGSSAANPLLALNNSRIIGAFPTGAATTTGFGLIESIVLNANGSVTVTTRAVVAGADLNMSVVVATPSNS